MSRCAHTRDYNGVEVGCKLRAGHDDPETGGPDYLHEVTCVHCAGMVKDFLAEDAPGMRCVKHGTREPSGPGA